MKKLLLKLIILIPSVMFGQTDNFVDFVEYVKNQEALKSGEFKTILCKSNFKEIIIHFDERGKIVKQIENDFYLFPVHKEYVYEGERLNKIIEKLDGRLSNETYFEYDKSGNCIKEINKFRQIAGVNMNDSIIEFGDFKNGKPRTKKVIIQPEIKYEYTYDDDGLFAGKESFNENRKNPNVSRNGNTVKIESFYFGEEKVSEIRHIEYDEMLKLKSYVIQKLKEGEETKYEYEYEYGENGLLQRIIGNDEPYVEINYEK